MAKERTRMGWKTDEVCIEKDKVIIERQVDENTYKVLAVISLEDIKRIAKAIAEDQKNDL